MKQYGFRGTTNSYTDSLSPTVMPIKTNNIPKNTGTTTVETKIRMSPLEQKFYDIECSLNSYIFGQKEALSEFLLSFKRYYIVGSLSGDLCNASILSGNRGMGKNFLLILQSVNYIKFHYLKMTSLVK
ncbi:MAG: hypothetical protein ACRCWI_04115 [Brevinema sp.]